MKKLQIIQNINNLMIQVIFIFYWILVKKNHSFLYPFLVLPGDMCNFILLKVWWTKLGGEFWVGKEAWVKMSRLNALFRNVNTINLGIFPTHGGIYKWVKIQQAFWREWKSWRVYRNMKGCILETNLEGQVLYHCLPIC